MVTVSDCLIDHNQAQGGGGGNGEGGGIANLLDAITTVSSSMLTMNLAIGSGGAGLGGGAYNDATSTLVLSDSAVIQNQANGSPGIGGGIYNLGTLSMLATYLKHNHASTSNDDLFG